MARRQREHNLLTNIDVTPLVDLTFILLIVFMVTAPALESRVQVPLMDADAKDSSNKTKNIVVSLDDLGNIYIDREMISLDDLPKILGAMSKEGKSFSLRGDESRTYGEVMTLMKLMRQAGIENVDLVTINEK